MRGSSKKANVFGGARSNGGYQGRNDGARPPYRYERRALIEMSGETTTHHGGGEKLGDQWDFQMRNINIEGPAAAARIEPLYSLDEANLSPVLMKNIKDKYPELSPLQRYTIPIMSDSRIQNVLVRAPTGSGKTDAFLIPAIQMVLDYRKHDTRRVEKSPLAIILSNTVNLTNQTHESAVRFAHGRKGDTSTETGCRVIGLYSQSPDRARDHATIDIIVATTGSLKRAISDNLINLKHVQMFILDEADKMIDMRAFGDDVMQIFNAIPEETKDGMRRYFFSATYGSSDGNGGHQQIQLDDNVLNLCKDPHKGGGNITLVDVPVSKGFITQRVIKIDAPISRIVHTVEELNQLKEEEFWTDPHFVKMGYIERLVKHAVENPIKGKDGKPDRPRKLVIFVERKITCNYMVGYLLAKGYNFLPANSDFTHALVQQVTQKFDRGEIQGIVATNKLARGQDLLDVDHVIVFDMAADFNDYKHRIGRTGRCGSGGVATVLFNCRSDSKHIKDLYQFFVFHEQRIPRWLYEAALRMHQAEELRLQQVRDIEQQYQYESDSDVGEKVMDAADLSGGEDGSDPWATPNES